jgi:ribokinase
MIRQPVITVVGSFAVGLTIRTPHVPVIGETLRGSDFDMGPGGKGSNQAVATARLGAQSSLVGIIGTDKLAEIATDLYAAEGVNTAYLKQTSEKSTGVGFIVLNAEGNNFIILDMAANNLMDAAYVDLAEDQIARSDTVMAVLEIPLEAAARAMELGKKHGVRTILNPAPAAPLPDSMFHNIDILTPNESELRIILGLSPDDPTPTDELAARLKARGVKTLIVTQGSKGALVYRDDAVTNVPAIPVEIVDTTGAGDAFNAGLAVALAEGRSLLEAVRYGCVTGTLACTKLGVIPSLATREQADRAFAQFRPPASD